MTDDSSDILLRYFPLIIVVITLIIMIIFHLSYFQYIWCHISSLFFLLLFKNEMALEMTLRILIHVYEFGSLLSLIIFGNAIKTISSRDVVGKRNPRRLTCHYIAIQVKRESHSHIFLFYYKLILQIHSLKIHIHVLITRGWYGYKKKITITACLHYEENLRIFIYRCVLFFTRGSSNPRIRCKLCERYWNLTSVL